MENKCIRCGGMLPKYCLKCVCKNMDIDFAAGLERAAEMVETWANGNTPITVDEIAAAIRKEVK